MSLQIAILKVLVSHPEGRATIAALNSDLCILNTSGSDWTNRLKRLAARASLDKKSWARSQAGRTLHRALIGGNGLLAGNATATGTDVDGLADQDGVLPSVCGRGHGRG